MVRWQRVSTSRIAKNQARAPRILIFTFKRVKKLLDKKIIAPSKRKNFKKNDWYLFYDPVNVRWIKVNEAGKEIILTIERFSLLQDVINSLKKRFKAKEETIIKFIEYLINANYLHIDSYKVREFNFGKALYPSSLYIHPTYRCNLNCYYCYNLDDREKYSAEGFYDELTFEEYKKLLTEVKEIGIRNLVFTGGEPLLRKDIFSIAKFSKDFGFHNSLITNGTLITPSNAKKIVELFDHISVSIDSYKEAENDQMRGKGTYKRVINGIIILKSFQGNVSCLGVAHKGNIDSLLDSRDFFIRKLGCNSFLPQFFIPHNQNNSDYFSNENKELKDLSGKYGTIRNEINKTMGVYRNIGLRNNCGMCSGELAVGADGKVFPCQSLLKEEFCGGNVRRESLSKILEDSAVFKEIRALSVDKYELCSDCDFRYLCGGGCRAIQYGIFKDLKKTFPLFCKFNKEIIINSMFESAVISSKDESQSEINNEEYVPECF
ncbi:MAG: radical SAM protein [Candidatus Aminicenantes bacterium]|nr:radical SAM protein [Candidatus Aminicenantes bacterium]